MGSRGGPKKFRQIDRNTCTLPVQSQQQAFNNMLPANQGFSVNGQAVRPRQS